MPRVTPSVTSASTACKPAQRRSCVCLSICAQIHTHTHTLSLSHTHTQVAPQRVCSITGKIMCESCVRFSRPMPWWESDPGGSLPLRPVSEAGQRLWEDVEPPRIQNESKKPEKVEGPERKIQAPRADEDEDDDDANPLLDFFEKVPFCGDKIIENLGLAE